MTMRKAAGGTKEKLTKGAILAAKYRARANALTDDERQHLRASAMSLISVSYTHLPCQEKVRVGVSPLFR